MHWTRMIIRPFSIQDKNALIELWQRCGLTRSWNDPEKDIDRKLAQQPDMFLVAAIDAEIIGSVMVGYDGHRGWMYYLAVCPSHQGRGFGRQLVHRAEELLENIGCPKVNIQIRTDNERVINFYRALDYDVEERVSMGKRLQFDE